MFPVLSCFAGGILSATEHQAERFSLHKYSKIFLPPSSRQAPHSTQSLFDCRKCEDYHTQRDISQLGQYCTLILRYTWWQIYHITMPLYYRIIYPFQMYYKIIYPSQIYYTLHNNIFLPDVSKISVSLRAILRADISLPIYLKLM